MTVRVYRSTDAGSPGDYANAVGAVIPVFDAILVTGYPIRSAASVTRSGALVTVVLSAHGFVTGQTHTISGAIDAEDDYNGNKIITVVDPDTFTFTVTGTPTSPATGTLKVATTTQALGWRARFSGVSATKRVYQLRAVSTGFNLRLDQTSFPHSARVRGFETMSDIDTGTGLFPTVAQFANGLFLKLTNGAGPRSWMAVGDERGLFFFPHTTATDAYMGFYFGDFPSFKLSDAYNCMIIGSDSETADPGGGRMLDKATGTFFGTGTGGHYIARSHTQTGSAIQVCKAGDMMRNTNVQSGSQGATAGSNIMTYPGVLDGGLHLSRYTLIEQGVGPRGLLRGLYEVCHKRDAMSGVAHLDTMQGSDVLASRTFQMIDVFDSGGAVNGRMGIEISNTWDPF